MTDPARTPCAIPFGIVAHLCSVARCDLTSEAAIQRDLERLFVLRWGEDQVSREHRLSPRDRPDFLIGGAVVVEAKGGRHRPDDVLRQLQRYAGHDQVAGIVVATAKAMALPPHVEAAAGRKVPCVVVNLGRALL